MPQRFLLLETLLIPAERIKLLNLNALMNDGNPGIEIGLFGMIDTFKIDGQAASRAYDILVNEQAAVNPPAPLSTSGVFLSVVICGDTFNADAIEWADLATNFGNDVTGVEMRVSTDPEGVTRQYTGDNASIAYDVLVSLAVNVPQTATA